MPIITSANVANAIVKLVAADALPALVGNLVMGNLVNRDYEPVLAQAGDTVNVPIAPQLVANNIAEGNAVQLQNPSLGNAQIVLNTHAESSLSFIAQAATAAGANTNSVMLDGIQLPVGGVSFHVYRGTGPGSLIRIASNQTSAPTFTDTGLAPLMILPPDPQFDHVDVNWRWELVPETPATVYSATTVGNPVLDLVVNKYQGDMVRITRGTGAGQEEAIASNTATVVTIGSAWVTVPDATSFFEIADNSWQVGASGNTSPITIDVPERIGAAVEISARAANVSDGQAAYDLSPLTSWILGQSGEIVADSGVPPAPVFGLVVSPVQGGVLELGEIAFGTLVNTTSILAGTYTFHFYDEVNGAAPLSLTTAIGLTDASIAFGTTFTAGALVQIEQEIVQITGTNSDGSSAVTRGAQNTAAAAHAIPVLVYILGQTAIIYPFIKNFFGSPVSGDWQNNVALPNVRLASVELYMTNALGDGAVTANSYTGTIDSGLRTMAGGQFSFQISGYLAVQTMAAPIVIVDADRSVRDIYGIVTTPSTGAPITLQLNRNGAAYVTVVFAAGATVSGVVGGFGLPALRAQDQLSLDIDGVGTTIPGSNLNLILRL